MNVFTTLRNVISGRDLEQEAVSLADDLESRVWGLVERRVGSLNRYEIRGYVRARAAVALNEELRLRPWSQKTAEIVRSMTLVELTDRFQNRLAYRPPQPMLRAA